MKAINNKIFPSVLACALVLSLNGCKDNSALVLPEQIETEIVDNTIAKGPVKQNNFKVITDDDELVKFDLSNVDKEKVKSVFFAYNSNGERIDTEVTNFDELYVIKNLPIRTISEVNVWASGHDNLLSNKYAYKVTPLPYSSTIVAENVALTWNLNQGYLRVFNTTRSTATLFYKIDNAAYKELVLPNPTMDLDIAISGLSRGLHTLSYYVTDVSGGQSKVFTKEFISYDIVEIANTELRAEVSSTESGEGAGNGVAASLIDGNINSYWHSTWSSSSNPVFPHWIILDLGSTRPFTALEMIRRHNNTAGGFKGFNVEYSSDKVVWNVLQKDLVFNSADSPAAFQRYSFTPVNTRYIRIYMTSPYNGTQTNTHLAEVKVYEVKGDN